MNPKRNALSSVGISAAVSGILSFSLARRKLNGTCVALALLSGKYMMCEFSQLHQMNRIVAILVIYGRFL